MKTTSKMSAKDYSEHTFFPLQIYLCKPPILSADEKETLKTRIRLSIDKANGK